ncbi:MAG TPA: hypothetical protein VEC93_23650 [Anaerolineae bacterium]|nr:hypothetical protein [Anaerolineae bacterium]
MMVTQTKGQPWAKQFIQSWPGALLLSLMLTLLMLKEYILPLNGILHHRDYILQLWNLWLVNESILSGQNPYFTNLQYYPLGAHLGRHVLSPGFFPLTFLVWAISGADTFYPIYTYKIIILLSYALILFFSYLVLREMELSWWACVVPAIAYAFCDFYMFHIHRLHLISGFFIPVVAFFLIRLFKKPALSTALICGVLLAAGLYFTELTLHIYLAILFLALIVSLFPQERQLLITRLRMLGLKPMALAALVFVLVAFIFVYNWLASDAQPPNSEEAVRYSANLMSFFIPAPISTPLYGQLFAVLNGYITVGSPGYEVFIGFPLLLLGLLALFQANQKVVRIASLLALIFFILSLGSKLKLFGLDLDVPLPYALFASTPPFNVGRTPVRFVALALFFWMIVAAHGLAWLQHRLTFKYGPSAALAAMILIFIWTIAEAYSPIRPEQSYTVPPQVEKIVAGPVINLPLKYHDPWALLPQIFYKQPTATGYVSRNSKKQQEYFETLRVLYAEALQTGSCQKFVDLGFRNIVIWPGVSNDVIFSLTHSPACSMNVVDLRN